jgi:site-specific DNA recombinase
VWNRLRYVKNPDTGKRVSRLNPPSEWMTHEVPALRIVSDELWTAAKARQQRTRHAVKSAGHLGRARRPQYLFSGLTRCGVCGAGFIMAGRNRLACFGARDQGRCDNLLTIRRDEVEARVLKALQEKLLRQDLFEEFCDEFTREMNRLRMEHRATLTAAEREIERIEVRRKKRVQSIIDGVPASEVRDELTANAAKREDLKAKLAAADAPPPLLHPEIAELYRQKVTTLAQALERPETRVEATEALRGLIDAIIVTPTDGELRIELKGNLAAMLSAATNAKRSPESDDLSLQVSLVAGARNQHYLQLWRPAARCVVRREECPRGPGMTVC